MNPSFLRRTNCPACNGTKARRLLSVPYDDPDIRRAMKRFCDEAGHYDSRRVSGLVRPGGIVCVAVPLGVGVPPALSDWRRELSRPALERWWRTFRCVGGRFTLCWHNSELDTPRKRQLFLSVLDA